MRHTVYKLTQWYSKLFHQMVNLHRVTWVQIECQCLLLNYPPFGSFDPAPFCHCSKMRPKCTVPCATKIALVTGKWTKRRQHQTSMWIALDKCVPIWWWFDSMPLYTIEYETVWWSIRCHSKTPHMDNACNSKMKLNYKNFIYLIDGIKQLGCFFLP